MKTQQTAPKTIDEYIAGFPTAVQEILKKVRTTIKDAAPEAEEAIKYGMPSFVFHGNLVYFGAFTHHIGFYPVPTGIEAFKQELSVYKMGKGSIQFPFDKPMPFDLITNIVQFRARENAERAATKSAAKKKSNKKST
jgi:uncharacterized protein YdhG (YjbR/CyaY superfamily)